jgi:hypothetical protein
VLTWLRAHAKRLLVSLGMLDRARRIRRRMAGGRARLRMRLSAPWYRRRLPDGVPGVVDVWHVDHWCPAVEDERLRARDIMASNLELAVGIVEAAGIPYTFVRISSRYRYRIAVPESARAALLAAIEGTTDSTLHLYQPADLLAGHEPWTAVPALGGRPHRRWRTSDTFRVFRAHADPAGRAVFDELHGCEIELWAEGGGNLSAPYDNLTAMRVSRDEFGSVATEVAGISVRTIPVESATPLLTDTPFPIDLVYTWVDGSDEAWLRRKAEVVGRHNPGKVAVDSDVAARYENRDELKYSLRSVDQFADFARHVYLVTAGQIPDWLDPTAPGLTVVDHHEIFGDEGALPTFNSHAIESRLHRIEGLAEHYVYMNDDFLFGRLVDQSIFFHPNGVAKFYMSPAAIAHEHLSVDRAANNARKLLEARFGRWVTNKMKHAPYPQRRSIIERMEADFPEAFATTARNQLRNASDIPVASSMAHYYGFLVGEAVPAAITNAYVDIGKAGYRDLLDEIAETRRYDVICLNDTGAEEVDPDERDAHVAAWLDTYYPVPSRWER